MAGDDRADLDDDRLAVGETFGDGVPKTGEEFMISERIGDEDPRFIDVADVFQLILNKRAQRFIQLSAVFPARSCAWRRLL